MANKSYLIKALAEALDIPTNTVSAIQRGLHTGARYSKDELSHRAVAKLFLACILPHPIRERPMLLDQLDAVPARHAAQWSQMTFDGPFQVEEDHSLIDVLANFLDRYGDGIDERLDDGQFDFQLSISKDKNSVHCRLDLMLFGDVKHFNFGPLIPLPSKGILVKHAVGKDVILHVAKAFLIYRINIHYDEDKLFRLEYADMERVQRGKKPLVTPDQLEPYHLLVARLEREAKKAKRKRRRRS